MKLSDAAMIALAGAWAIYEMTMYYREFPPGWMRKHKWRKP